MLPTMTNLVALLILILILGDPNNITIVSGFSTIPISSSRTTIRSRNRSLNQIISTRSHGTHAHATLSRLSLSNHLLNVKDDDPEGGDAKLIQAEINVDDEELISSQIQSLQTNNNSLLSTVREFFTNKAKFNRESLSKLGMSALLAYGFVSNVSGVIAVSSAWFIFSKRTGLSPMAPGQKSAFLAMYAGFTLALNIVRPARFALSMAISPYFERIRTSIQRKFGVSPKGAAVLMIVFINMMGTCSLMALGVGLASILSGVPVWVAK